MGCFVLVLYLHCCKHAFFAGLLPYIKLCCFSFVVIKKLNLTVYSMVITIVTHF